MKIKVFINNWTFKSGYLAEHGLSLYIEKDGKKILFDCGQTDAMLKNLEKAKIDLNFDAVVLSHSHYDHTGGLKSFIDRLSCPVFVHEGFFEQKYALRDGKFNFIGHNFEEGALRFKIVKDEVYELFEDIYLLNVKSHAEGSEEFYIGKDGRFEKDLFLEEQSLVIKEKGKLILISGCSHNGIENIIKRAEEIFESSIFATIGGFHSKDFPEEKMDELCKFFEKHRVYKIIPLHCSGIRTLTFMGKSLPNKLKIAGCGDEIEL
ncbi:MBL fold metallo-hydrolase [Caldicellulosiruptor morganii]|uniref:MBL fold metallo-hydrolase n=1 Tax=Caldicellulosiruptor morganii TaxID=1387555 RepID=A0ABY7BQA5_9FIRM|nr:MBL fold metallo-hydrolase [Caldicellulosiruptor morganii]WAM34226.1 MBL fold metallo-hydrolase [Caldicellulosiruptor morganii]